jgi:hypothetical protein
MFKHNFDDFVNGIIGACGNVEGAVGDVLCFEREQNTTGGELMLYLWFPDSRPL